MCIGVNKYVRSFKEGMFIWVVGANESTHLCNSLNLKTSIEPVARVPNALKMKTLASCVALPRYCSDSALVPSSPRWRGSRQVTSVLRLFLLSSLPVQE